MNPKPLGPVIRHLTSLQPFKSTSTFSPPRLTSLRDKSPVNGNVPGRFANLFITNHPTPSLTEPDLSETPRGSSTLVAENGANFRVTDIAPKTKGVMHSTDSLDFLVVHKGRVTLHLDSGERAEIGEGEVIVQRGTVHAWENKTDEWVRMFVVLLHADREA